MPGVYAVTSSMNARSSPARRAASKADSSADTAATLAGRFAKRLRPGRCATRSLDSRARLSGLRTVREDCNQVAAQPGCCLQARRQLRDEPSQRHATWSLDL